MSQLDPLWLAWFAGLVDGEGSFVLGCTHRKTHARKNRPEYEVLVFAPTVVIKMHEREAVHLNGIQRIIGFGKRYHINRQLPTAGESWQTTRWEESFQLCCLLWPYLQFKRRQAEVLAQACICLSDYSSNGGYNGHVDRLWTLLQIREGLNPGTFRNEHRLKITLEMVEQIVADQKRVGLTPHFKRERITNELMQIIPADMPLVFPEQSGDKAGSIELPLFG